MLGPLMHAWISREKVAALVECAGNEWTGHHQSEQELLPIIYVWCLSHRSQPPPGLPEWLIKPGYKHMTSHHTLANLMNNPGIVATTNMQV